MSGINPNYQTNYRVGNARAENTFTRDKRILDAQPTLLL